MSDNNMPSENIRGKKADAELEKLLIQVFGSKENLENERKKVAQGYERKTEISSPEVINREQQGKKRISPPHRSGSPNHRQTNPRDGVKRKPPEQRTGQGNVHRKPKSDGELRHRSRLSDERHRRDYVRSESDVEIHRRPRPKISKPRPSQNDRHPQRSRPNNSEQRHNLNKRTNAKKKKHNSINQKLSKLTGWKKSVAVAGIIIGVILLLMLFVYGVYSFYFSLFGKYSGGLNSGKYQYDSSDYVDGPDTMTEEDLKKQLAATATDPMQDKDVFNILLIGEDLRDTEIQERGNTDVMMMISLNKKLKTITMTSFLRDTWVDIDGYGTAKLNAAYWRDGPELLKDTIEKYYGVSIDRYVIVNFESFMTIVDTLGGLELDVTDEEAEGMKEPMAEQNDILGNKRGTDYLQSGGNGLLLNGNQALAYARLRYVGNADYERTERQRRVITKIIEESKKLNLLEINSLLTKTLPQIKIDITKEEMNSLLLNCLDYMNYSVQELQIPSSNLFTEEVISNLAVLCPDFPANSQLLIKTIYGEDAVSSEYDEYNQDDTYNNYGYNYNYN